MQQLVSFLRNAARPQDQVELWAFADNATLHVKIYDPALQGYQTHIQLSSVQEDPEPPVNLDNLDHSHVVQVEVTSLQRFIRVAKESKATDFRIRLQECDERIWCFSCEAEGPVKLDIMFPATRQESSSNLVSLAVEPREVFAIDESTFRTVFQGSFNLEYIHLITKSLQGVVPLRMYFGQAPLMVQVGDDLFSHQLRYLLAPCLSN
jgi:hypothetical protein